METTSVIIVGCGPTGALLSGLLGKMSVPNIVLEREKEIPTDPRGIALDEEGIRLLQELGIYDKVHTEFAKCIGWLLFISGKDGLATKPFTKMDMTTTEGGTGHVGVIADKQPVMEKYMRQAATSHVCSEIRLGATIIGIEEDEDYVYAKYIDVDAVEHTIRAKFLVGADGKTGFTRKKYLEPKGVKMESVAGYEYEQTWVAMNWRMDLPTPETHPHFPLWKLDYTPQEVFDTFFPPDFRFIANPERPAVCGTFGLTENRLWRFEFVIDESEDAQDMASWEKASGIVLPYLTHPGSRYGLEDSIQYPLDCIRVLRCRPFSFGARSCNQWSVDRVILVGDAAHVMPPFGGQGIASGFRDASGLSWRLALACRPQFEGRYQDLFHGWFLERKQQLDQSLAATIFNGNMLTMRHPLKILLRDWTIWALTFIPSWRREFELGPRAAGMHRYNFVPGMHYLPRNGGGSCLPQVYCRSILQEGDEEPPVQFTDDVLFAGKRRDALLRLLVMVDSLEQAERAWVELKTVDLEQASDGEVSSEAALILLHSPSVKGQETIPNIDIPHDSTYRIAAAEEFAASPLCNKRPYPTGYNMYRMRNDTRGRKYILVRPDRFIFAACSTTAELFSACQLIPATLLGRTETDNLRTSKL